MIFLDTNILIYASGIHGDDDPRTGAARRIVGAAEPYVISVQVLHEFYDRVTRPARTRQLTDNEAGQFVGVWRSFQILPLTVDLFDRAIAIRQRLGFRYYDSSIIAAALAAGSHTLLSEDLQNGQVIDGLRITNPFAGL